MDQRERQLSYSYVKRRQSFHRKSILPEEPLQPKAIRVYMTVLIVGFYIGWAILSVILFLCTGNALLLLMLPGLAYPIHKVVDYYFARRQ